MPKTHEELSELVPMLDELESLLSYGDFTITEDIDAHSRSILRPKPTLEQPQAEAQLQRIKAALGRIIATERSRSLRRAEAAQKLQGLVGLL